MTDSNARKSDFEGTKTKYKFTRFLLGRQTAAVELVHGKKWDLYNGATECLLYVWSNSPVEETPSRVRLFG